MTKNTNIFNMLTVMCDAAVLATTKHRSKNTNQHLKDMKTLEPNMIIRFPDKPDYICGKITVEASRPRKFLCFKWMSKFKKVAIPLSILKRG